MEGENIPSFLFQVTTHHILNLAVVPSAYFAVPCTEIALLFYSVLTLLYLCYEIASTHMTIVAVVLSANSIVPYNEVGKR